MYSFSGLVGNYREYLLSIQGLGIKSTECVRLLTLEHTAFPVSSIFQNMPCI